MTGREVKIENDLFFVCSIIEYVGRKTKNYRFTIVEKFGDKELSYLLEFADILHCEPIENISCELIKKYNIIEGIFDNVNDCIYSIPTYFDIAKVYKRLIISISKLDNLPLVKVIAEVYSSWISSKIDDYNSSMYFENPDYIFESYKEGNPL